MLLSMHVRLTEAGNFELVKWVKDQHNKKVVIIAPYKPTTQEAIQIASSRYQEIILPTIKTSI